MIQFTQSQTLYTVRRKKNKLPINFQDNFIEEIWLVSVILDKQKEQDSKSVNGQFLGQVFFS